MKLLHSIPKPKTYGLKGIVAGGFLCAAISGCMHPGYYGQPYPPPTYAPPQTLSPPGTLTIPPSDAPLYNPNGTSIPRTYDDPQDDFRPDDGGVPSPRDPSDSNDGLFRDETDGSFYGTSVDRPEDTMAARPASVDVQTFAADESTYGYDNQAYAWLRGILRRNVDTGDWNITYNLNETDRLGGDLNLQVEPGQLDGYISGTPVEVRGEVLEVAHDHRGRPLYGVASIRRLQIPTDR